MTSTLTPPPAPASAVAVLPRPTFRPATFADAMRSEWTKLRSVRSTYWGLIVAAILGIGLGALISGISASHYATDPGIRAGWDPTDRAIRSLSIAQLAFAILGVMVVTGEYSTGMIRTSLAAVPKRSRMLAAKAVVFTTVALVAGEVISFAAFLIGQVLISGKAPSASLGQHNVLRAVIGAGLYLAVLGLLGIAIGVLLRHAAAAIGSIVAILLVLPGIAAALPTSWSNPIEQWWPTNAGTQVAVISRDSHTLAAWTGFGVMAAFTAVVLAGAFLLIERRDA
jgi:ABC-2 type transport system permease protein